MSLRKIGLFCFFCVLINCSALTFACDLCAIHSSLDSAQASPNTFHLSLAEQFTSYGKMQENGQYKFDEAHQHMESSIAQVVGAYDFNEKFGMQISLPYINRRYRRYESGAIENGTEAGIGDLSLIAKYRPLEIRDGDQIYILQVFGGLKFATGDSDMLNDHADGDHDVEGPVTEDHDEEHSSEVEHEHHTAELSTRHAGHDHESEQMVSSIHGHDLALGSGSYDFPVGINFFVEQGRAFLSSSVQYSFRTEGDFDYEYGDDLIWDIGPAYYLSLDHDSSVAFKVNLSGEYKRKDNVDGETENDTGLNALFIGPELIFRCGDNWSADVAWDAPLNIQNSGTQTVAEYRLRAALNYRF